MGRQQSPKEPTPVVALRAGAAAAKPEGRYHHGELRRALVATALEIVEREGVAALTLRELARRLGVSHAAPAHHFPDKAALLAELAREGFDRLTAAMRTAGATAASAPARLRAVGEAYVAFATEHPAFLRVMFGRDVADLADPPAALREAGDRSFGVLLDAVGAVLEAHPPASRPPADAVAFTCWSLVHGMAMLWIDGPLRCHGPAAEARAQFERGAAVAFELLGRALAPPARPRAPRPARRAR